MILSKDSEIPYINGFYISIYIRVRYLFSKTNSLSILLSTF